jgi:hypothetical protein
LPAELTPVLDARIPRTGSAERERDQAERGGIDPDAGDLPRQVRMTVLATASGDQASPRVAVRACSRSSCAATL